MHPTQLAGRGELPSHTHRERPGGVHEDGLVPVGQPGPGEGVDRTRDQSAVAGWAPPGRVQDREWRENAAIG
jgi:hypothetical protein